MAAEHGFGGTIGRTYQESTPQFEEPVHAGPDAPDVVVILFDDLGFGHFGCYGSTIDTPNVDALAAGGLRFTNFHTTPLCSPTRASLLTGRNSHTVGMRSVANFVTGFPNMTGHISDRAATIAEVLGSNGYTTFALGKWHLCPMDQASAAGPFDQWPLGRGFDRFYGFMQGETDQFAPELTYDNHHIEPPKTAAEGYHLSEDLVDQGLGFIRDSVSIRPDRPFFCYLAFGATHAPHQAPPEYLAKYRGRFDAGWDKAREEWFARQLAMGVVPEGTVLAPRNPGVQAWDALDDNGRAVAARLQEAYAAFLDHTDAQIGRFIDGLRRLGRLDNTIVIVTSDNGASQEGGPFGIMHEMKFFNGVFETPDVLVRTIDDIGGPHSHTNYPWGWAQAGNTPNRWYKQNTHGGGVRDPLIVHWPARITDAGGIRHQFHHVSDLAPTLYELVGVDAPAVHRGVEQLPVSGTSLAYAFDAPAEPSRKGVQYFENGGHRGIYHDGWKAVTRHDKGADYDEERWELFNLDEDFSECNDLADAMPEKVAEMAALWWSEAERFGVLPLDDRGVELFGARFRPHSPHINRTYTYHPPVSHLPAEASPPLGGRSFEMRATIEHAAGDDGVLFATGTENSGLSFFVQHGKLVFDYNTFGRHTVAESDHPVPEGACTVTARLERDRSVGTVTLEIDGAPCGTATIPWMMRMMSSIGADVGIDRLSPVSDRYTGTFPFAGVIHRLDVEVAPTRSEREAEEAAQAGFTAEMSRQ